MGSCVTTRGDSVSSRTKKPRVGWRILSPKCPHHGTAAQQPSARAALSHSTGSVENHGSSTEQQELLHTSVRPQEPSQAQLSTSQTPSREGSSLCPVLPWKREAMEMSSITGGDGGDGAPDLFTPPVSCSTARSQLHRLLATAVMHLKGQTYP